MGMAEPRQVEDENRCLKQLVADLTHLRLAAMEFEVAQQYCWHRWRSGVPGRSAVREVGCPRSGRRQTGSRPRTSARPPVVMVGIIGRGLQQAQLTGAGDGLGAPLDHELAEDHAVVSFDRIHGEEESLADFTVREPLGDEA